MRRIYAKFFLALSILFSSVSASAQTPVYSSSNKQNSPYSRYGIGEMRNGLNTVLKGMGSPSAAYASGFHVNTDNPATYASLLLTSYEGGGEGDIATVLSGNDKYKTGMATLSYMNIGIPLGKYMGMAVGLKPVSRAYYFLNDTTNVDTLGMAIKNYQGDGSLNQGFIGFAGKYAGVSLGFNFGYTFGTTENSSFLIPVDQTTPVLTSEFQKKTRLGGIYWNAGALYEHNITDKLLLRGGGTFTLSQDMKAHRDEYWISHGYQSDTVYKATDSVGKVMLPMKYSFGLQAVGGNWSVAIDYSAANWSDYRNYGMGDSLGARTYRISAGGEYTPDPNATKKYLSRMTYRLGFYYGTDPVMLRSTQLNYYAVTAGFTLPFRKNVGRIHTSLEVGSRGTTANGLIRENFVKFGVGLSFNDRWFIKTHAR